MSIWFVLIQEMMMKSLWRWRMVGVVLFCGSSIVGCESTQHVWHPGRPLQETKLTIEQAHAILSRSGQGITQFGAFLPNEDRGPATATATVRRSEFELRGQFSDVRGGTFVMRVPFTGDPIPIFWRLRIDNEWYVRFGTATYGAFFRVDSAENPQRFVDAIQAVRDYAAKGKFIGQNEVDNFAQVVSRYQSGNPKPVLSEEVRRLVVQAEFAVEKKQYGQAIDRYEEALNIAPWWAEGHFNRALLLGEAEQFDEAVSEMKKYLALEPYAKDARAAKDKLYRWEGEAKPMADLWIRIDGRPPQPRP